ncbi:MAG: hypothetical protein OEU26_16620, partial [Candidatus Tectomicrobia bacterium]|nr:hypothetical protein [Candidatus Tectomicrobia bacterium]
HFKGIGKTPKDVSNPYEQGSAFFTTGHLGQRLSPHLDEYADKARVSRRDLMKSICGFTGALLAVNQVTGMRFFDVEEAEAYDPKATLEQVTLKKGRAGYVVDTHSHICWRKDGYVLGKNTSEKGMWFVQLLDNLGKAMGLPNGTQDMTVDNFGKIILDKSDTSVAIYNPFGFREDYGGKDMVPIEEQAEIRERWPERTIMLGGGLTPNQGLPETLERLHMFVEQYKISGLKLYTFDSTPKRGW